MKILEIQASARSEGSITRALTQKMIAQLTTAHKTEVLTRNLAEGIPFVTNKWINNDDLARKTSNTLIDELEWADSLVIGLPIYNFGVPASFKAWFDQIAMAGRTFQYKDGWPVGKLKDRPTWVIIASDGVPVGSEYDFATPWLQTAFKMLGINDIRFINADGHLLDDQCIKQAEAFISNLQIS